MQVKNSVDEINSKSAMKYARKVIEWINKEEAKAEVRKLKSKSDMI